MYNRLTFLKNVYHDVIDRQLSIIYLIDSIQFSVANGVGKSLFRLSGFVFLRSYNIYSVRLSV